MLKTDNRGPMGDSRYDKGETSPRCLTPVRSITEIYRSAETHLQKLMTEVDGGHSSDEGGYSLPRRDQDPLDGSTLDKLVKCVDKIRGFGSRKLTEQEICNFIPSYINLQFPSFSSLETTDHERHKSSAENNECKDLG